MEFFTFIRSKIQNDHPIPMMQLLSYNSLIIAITGIDDIFLVKTRIPFFVYILQFSSVFSLADYGQKKLFSDVLKSMLLKNIYIHTTITLIQYAPKNNYFRGSAPYKLGSNKLFLQVVRPKLRSRKNYFSKRCALIKNKKI